MRDHEFEKVISGLKYEAHLTALFINKDSLDNYLKLRNELFLSYIENNRLHLENHKLSYQIQNLEIQLKGKP